jgi:hypothetical protein
MYGSVAYGAAETILYLNWRSKNLLENLIVSQLIKELCPIYENQTFFTVRIPALWYVTPFSLVELYQFLEYLTVSIFRAGRFLRTGNVLPDRTVSCTWRRFSSKSPMTEPQTPFIPYSQQHATRSLSWTGWNQFTHSHSVCFKFGLCLHSKWTARFGNLRRRRLYSAWTRNEALNPLLMMFVRSSCQFCCRVTKALRMQSEPPAYGGQLLTQAI